MRRFPDFSRLAARVALAASLACIGAGVMWFARATGDALLATAKKNPSPGASVEPVRTTVAVSVDPVKGEQVRADDLFAAGRELWQKYAPAEMRATYEFPSLDEVRIFLSRLEAEIDDGSSEEIAAYEREARRALQVLRRCEGGDLLAAWLEPRLDLLKAASQVATTPPANWPEALPDAFAPETAEPSLAQPEAGRGRPQFTRGYWDRVLTDRKAPRRAAEFVPRLKEIFEAVGVPPELVWIAEVESSMNPEATSPVGARGLFQFMPVTAARFGLGTDVMLDERTDPEKSAHAAATYLRVLHRRFRSWPLALAAYNAGEGRVGRLLVREQASTFEAVAHRLPVETRMYVPKVLATVAAREQIDPDALPSPVRVAAMPERVLAVRVVVPLEPVEPGPDAVAAVSPLPAATDLSAPFSVTAAPASF